MGNNKSATYAICINNVGCDDLVMRKVYTIIKDEQANSDGYIRIIDESGEDYLYPTVNFVIIPIPKEIEKKLRMAS